MKINKVSIASIAIALGAVLRADDLSLISLEGVSLGHPVVAGTGCKTGTVFPILDRESQELLILFDDFIVEAENERRVARKNCSLSIPIHLPSGVQVSILEEKIQGFNYLPRGGSTVVNSESFFTGSKGDLLSTQFDGSLEEDFMLQKLTDLAPSVSGDTNLRVNTSIRVKTNENGDYAAAGIMALGETANSIAFQLKFLNQ